METKAAIDKQKTYQTQKIPFTQLAAYGAGGIIPIALFNVAGILVGLMGNISLGLSAFWLGFILIIPRLWDAVSDPIIGHLSDNTRTKWGRRRPYLLLGGILVAIFFVVLWWIPKGDTVQQWFSTESSYQFFQLSYILIALLLFFTAVTIFEIPHGALGMEMTTDYHERTKLFSAKSFVGNLFAMSTPWLFALANMEIFKGPGGNEADGMRYVSIMIAVILIPLSFWWFFKLKEPGFKKVSRQKKTHFWEDMKIVVRNKNFVLLTLSIFTLAMGFNFVQLLGSYIPIFYVFAGDKVAGATMLGINGTVWAITGVLAVFPLNWISPKLGKRKTLMIAMGLMITAQLSKIVCYNPDYPYLILVPTILLSAGMLFFFTLGSSMVGDICDEDELHTGKRTEGSYYAVFWWFIKMGTALASFVSGALIVLTMFDASQVTKVDKISGNINEMFTQVELYLQKNDTTIEQTNTFYKNQIIAAIKETNEYAALLENERSRPPKKQYPNIAGYSERHRSMTSETFNSVKNTAEILSGQGKQVEGNIGNALFDGSGFPSLLQTKLHKAGMNAFELKSHIDNKSFEPHAQNKPENIEHYQVLNLAMDNITQSLSELQNVASLDEIRDQLNALKVEIEVLKKQTPHTLLLMRIVEIGIPVLLSILSLLLVFRYSLTEGRSLEIKELLIKRNEMSEVEAQ